MYKHVGAWGVACSHRAPAHASPLCEPRFHGVPHGHQDPGRMEHLTSAGSGVMFEGGLASIRLTTETGAALTSASFANSGVFAAIASQGFRPPVFTSAEGPLPILKTVGPAPLFKVICSVRLPRPPKAGSKISCLGLLRYVRSTGTCAGSSLRRAAQDVVLEALRSASNIGFGFLSNGSGG